MAASLDEDWEPIDRFLEKIPVTFPVLRDPEGVVAGIFGAYQLPESYLIDSEGIILKKYRGPREWDSPKLVSEISRFLEN